MARFRRKPKVIWLPPAAENRVGGTPNAVSGINPGMGVLELDTIGGTFGTVTSGLVPVFSDLPSPEFDPSGVASVSLSDMYNSGYRLRRIVGKIFCEMQQSSVDAPLTGASTIALTVGLIVLRVNPDGTPLQDATHYSPAIINSWSDPWIWRRTWILGDVLVAGGAATGLNVIWPENNAQYGSVADGPHIDAKTARIISQEERVFLVGSTVLLSSPLQDGDTGARIFFDLRGVATLRSNLGNRRNASR